MTSTASQARPSRGDVLELTIDSLAHGGNGVARRDGYVVFVTGGLPGDRVRARITRSKRDFGEAKAVELLRPSPDVMQPLGSGLQAGWRAIAPVVLRAADISALIGMVGTRSSSMQG